MAEDHGPAAGESQHPASLGKRNRWDILAEDSVDAVDAVGFSRDCR